MKIYQLHQLDLNSSPMLVIYFYSALNSKCEKKPHNWVNTSIVNRGCKNKDKEIHQFHRPAIIGQKCITDTIDIVVNKKKFLIVCLKPSLNCSKLVRYGSTAEK